MCIAYYLSKVALPFISSIERRPDTNQRNCSQKRKNTQPNTSRQFGLGVSSILRAIVHIHYHSRRTGRPEWSAIFTSGSVKRKRFEKSGPFRVTSVKI